VIEAMTMSAQNLVEGFQMQRIGVGKRAVNIEQQSLSRGYQHRNVLLCARLFIASSGRFRNGLIALLRPTVI
jgi:hypothetical protein